MIELNNADTLGTPRHKGNTRKFVPKRTRNRARSWCFTWNNYDKNSMAHLAKQFEIMKTEKYIFQEEIGEEKVEHIQGFVKFKNPRELSALKRISQKIHWEKTRDIKGSIIYCSKEKTRNGEIVSKGVQIEEMWREMPKYIKKTYSEILLDMKSQMKEDIGDIVSELPDMYIHNT